MNVYDSFARIVRENNQMLDKTFVYYYNNIGNITFLTTGTLFDFLELNPKYNTRQPIIDPKNK